MSRGLFRQLEQTICAQSGFLPFRPIHRERWTHAQVERAHVLTNGEAIGGTQAVGAVAPGTTAGDAGFLFATNRIRDRSW